MIDVILFVITAGAAGGWYQARRDRINRTKQLHDTADNLASRLARRNLGRCAEPDFASTPTRRRPAICRCRHALGAHVPECTATGCPCTEFVLYERPPPTGMPGDGIPRSG